MNLRWLNLYVGEFRLESPPARRLLFEFVCCALRPNSRLAQWELRHSYLGTATIWLCYSHVTARRRRDDQLPRVPVPAARVALLIQVKDALRAANSSQARIFQDPDYSRLVLKHISRVRVIWEGGDDTCN